MCFTIKGTLTTNVTILNNYSICRKCSKSSHTLPVHCWEWFIANNVFIRDVHINKLKKTKTQKNNFYSITNTVRCNSNLISCVYKLLEVTHQLIIFCNTIIKDLKSCLLLISPNLIIKIYRKTLILG